MYVTNDIFTHRRSDSKNNMRRKIFNRKVERKPRVKYLFKLEKKKRNKRVLNLNHRCDKASEIGVTRLATVRCPTGLAFDIERQTCDWKTNVKNCDQLESKRFTSIAI